MDARKDRIGAHAAGHTPPWAINALGPVPGHPLDRLDSPQRARSIGAWRARAGYRNPPDPTGPQPAAAPPHLLPALRARRADGAAATRHQRRPAVAADAELRRRHPAQHCPPLRSAEPEPLTQDQRDQLTLTPGQQTQKTSQWITDLAAQHHAFA